MGVRVRLPIASVRSTLEFHTTGIFRSAAALEDFDLPEDCLGPPVRHVTLYSPQARRPLRLESPHDEFRSGAWSDYPFAIGRMRGDGRRLVARDALRWIRKGRRIFNHHLSRRIDQSVEARFLIGVTAHARAWRAL